MTKRSTPFTLPDLRGRRAVITGASDGIGLEIATRLAQAGAEVVLPVRSAEKGRAAALAIREHARGAKISLRALDLSSLHSVGRLAAELLGEGDPIHLLINNAGVMTPPERCESVDGFELQFATNHLGHVALVAHLLPLLRAGGARVTSQVSIAANRGAINWNDLNWTSRYDAMQAYSQSKIALGLFGLELHRRSHAGGWGITSNVAHPGVAATNLLAAHPEYGRDRQPAVRRVIGVLSRRGLLLGTAETAALPALLAATDDRGEERFYGPGGLGRLGGPPAPQRLYSRLSSDADAARIWDRSVELTGVSFPDVVARSGAGQR